VKVGVKNTVRFCLNQLMAERGRQMRGVRCTRRARLHFVGAMVPGCVASLLSRG